MTFVEYDKKNKITKSGWVDEYEESTCQLNFIDQFRIHVIPFEWFIPKAGKKMRAELDNSTYSFYTKSPYSNFYNFFLDIKELRKQKLQKIYGWDYKE